LLGSAVAAYYAADDMYYRAKIVGFDDDGIEVLCHFASSVLGEYFNTYVIRQGFYNCWKSLILLMLLENLIVS